MDFKLEQQVKVAVTHNFPEAILETLKDAGYNHPFIVLDKFLLEFDLIKEMLNTLKNNDINYFIYDEVIPDPPIEIVDKGVKLFAENNCDSVLAIGGGSVIDSARGINVVRHLGGSISDYVTDKPISERCKGLISCPTTSGTGSELSNTAVVTDTKTHQKLAVLSDNAVSEYAILCPELVVSLPLNQTIFTGLDVFSHAAEAYTSNISSPVVDAICEKIMFLVVKYLPKVIKNGNDLEARQEMMVAAALGGWVLNNGGTHIGHSQAHILGPKLNIPHGMACGYSLPGTLLYTSQVEPKKIREIGNILNCEFPQDATDLEIGQITSEGYKNFRDNIIGLQPFEELNVEQDQILAEVDNVKNERFASNSPFELTDTLVADILHMFG